MKKLSGFISVLCVLNVLAIVGLLAYLMGTGRLDKTKAQTITDILRTPATPANFRTDVYDLMSAAASTQPTTTAAASSKGSNSSVAMMTPVIRDANRPRSHWKAQTMESTSSPWQRWVQLRRPRANRFSNFLCLETPPSPPNTASPSACPKRVIFCRSAKCDYSANR